MTEKEFLYDYLRFLAKREPGILDGKSYIDEFLGQFHKDYYEVEFIRKEEGKKTIQDLADIKYNE